MQAGGRWNATVQSPYFDYVNQSDGKRRRIWYDNAKSIAVKASLACELGLRGVGAWITDALPVWDPGLCAPMWEALERPAHCHQ